MKKGFIFLVLFFLIVVLAAITNPKIEVHREVISKKINEQVFDKEENPMAGFLGGSLTDIVAKRQVSIENYVLFSITKFKKRGLEKTIGFGLFGNIFLNDEFKEMLKEYSSDSEAKNSKPDSQPEKEIASKKEIIAENKPKILVKNKVEKISVVEKSSEKKVERKEPKRTEKMPVDTLKKTLTPIKKSNKSIADVFGQKEGQMGTGNDGFGNEQLGDGSGPGIKAKFGRIDATEGTSPKITNPTIDEEGKVVIKLLVNRGGKVIEVNVLATHPKTTTFNPVLLKDAKNQGYKFEFSSDPKREEVSIAYRIINYTLR